jgi:hypothetical protein
MRDVGILSRFCPLMLPLALRAASLEEDKHRQNE